jgi:phosphate starvation-inducible PhoH-like protein
MTVATRTYPEQFVNDFDQMDDSPLLALRGEGIRCGFRGTQLDAEPRHMPRVQALVDDLLIGWRQTGRLDVPVKMRDARQVIPGIRPRTPGQQKLLDVLASSTVTFATGPAGTGKTFLAIAYAVSCLKNNSAQRLVLTRPVVESGERLGFLPGTLEEKIDPYLRPLWDALVECDYDPTAHADQVEIAPLAYMRGRTLKNAIVLLDEAQNATAEQMKMLLTRLGEGSRIIVTGDERQSDLMGSRPNGLTDFMQRHEGREIEGIGVIRMTKADVVRHPLVARLLDLYEPDE